MECNNKSRIFEKINVPITQRKVVTTRISRNPYTARYVRMRANGYCELCSRKAPFEVNGEPFLEIDHIIPFSHGGTDSIDNLAALCPNCNRMKAHKFDDIIFNISKQVSFFFWFSLVVVLVAVVECRIRYRALVPEGLILFQ